MSRASAPRAGSSFPTAMMMAAFQAPIIMMSQNREAQKDRLRADLDYQVNLKNEMLLGEILRLLEKREKDAPKRYEDE